MIVALYLQASAAGPSVESQRAELASYAAGKGWIVSAEFLDEYGDTGTGLASCMQLAIDKVIGAVLCARLTRFARSTPHLLQLIEVFAETGVALVCPAVAIDTTPTTNYGRRQMAALAAVAAFARDSVRERTRAGLALARANGKAIGKVSPTMPAEGERNALVKEWREQSRPGGYPELARRLGGVSRATAMRVENKYCSNLPILELEVE